MTRSTPLSPHLQVYKWQLPMVLSITHRATGVFLAAASLLLCLWTLSVAAGPDAYAALLTHMGAWYGKLLLAGICFSTYYHLGNGVRHLFWDVGSGFDLPRVYFSGYLVILFSVLMTIGTFFLGCRG